MIPIQASFEIRVSDNFEKLLRIWIVENEAEVNLHNEPMIVRMLKFF